MVHERMSKQIRVASTNWPSFVNYLVFSRNGYSSMDCEFRDISFKIQRSVWRNNGHY
ncbi:hypothetical protein LINPERHAP2_LOCUS725 [Linum perenne]